MEVKHERCCGIDVHKKSVTACVIAAGPDGQPKKETRSFGTMSDELMELSRWLK
jgi:transposase